MRSLDVWYGPYGDDSFYKRICHEYIFYRELRTLQPGTWLNDTIINSYFYLMVQRQLALLRLPVYHSYRSHFFNQLLQVDHRNPELRGQYDYTQVSGYHKNAFNKDLFRLRTLLIPVNIGYSHWTLVHVDFPNHSIHYYDSMGSSGTGYLLATLRYLQDNHLRRHGTALPGNWQVFSPARTIPQQENTNDCGVFVCSFADNILRGLPITTTQPTAIGMYRYWIAHAIIRGVLPPITPHT